jgi:pilus assembly protein TadC
MRNNEIRMGAAALAMALLLMPLPALAYIGPGLGAGLVSAVVGVLGSIFLGLFAVIWYPIKRMRKKRQKNKQSGSSTKDVE